MCTGRPTPDVAARVRRGDRVVSELLRRWAAGDEAALGKAVKASRPATPDAAETERLHQKWMQENPRYARACTETADTSKLPRYRTLGELLAAGALRRGRTVTPEAVAAVDADDAEDRDV